MAALGAAAQCLKAARSIWIGTHRDPDGDAVGSLLGLGHLLRDRGIAVTLACQDGVPNEFRFLHGSADVVSVGPQGHDLAVAVDAGDLERLGALIEGTKWAAQPTVVLDHHQSNMGFGDVNVVLPSVSSTSEIVLELAYALPAPISVPAATALLTGLLSDTLGFRTTNTSAETLRRAAALVDLGADQGDLLDRVFGSRPLAALRLLGRAIERLEVRGQVAVSALDAADLIAAGAVHEDSRGISSFLISARELQAVALVRQRTTDTCDVSMRSRQGTDLGQVAKRLGGGGHPQAAGATLPGTLDAACATVWEAFRAEALSPS